MSYIGGQSNWSWQFNLTDSMHDIAYRAVKLPVNIRTSFVRAEADDEGDACCILNAIDFAINKGIKV